MHFVPNPELGNRIITLMAALVLVLQIAAVGQRGIVSSIRIFAVQSSSPTLTRPATSISQLSSPFS
jgi:hypothetical protein